MASWAWRGVRRSVGGWLAACLLGAAPLSAALAQVADERPEVRVVVDVSGSMRSTDPERLAASALTLLAVLLPDDTQAGVWTFGERVASPLPPSAVDETWRERAMALRAALEEYQQYTDIEAAIRAAEESPGAGERHLVLLTDGVIDLPPARGAKPALDDASRRRLLDELAPDLARRGTTVHAIAFSDEADLALVEQLSRTTGGLPAVVHSPESLLGAFLDIVERIFPGEQIPLDEGRFTIESDVEAFSALLFHAPGDAPLMLVAPDGTRHTPDAPPPGGRWQSESHFDLLRVPAPAPGEWRLEGDIGDGSRIGVQSALSLHVAELPATLYLGLALPVEAWLTHDGDPWTEMPEDLTLHVALLDGDETPLVEAHLTRRGAHFVGELPAPPRPGAARLRIRAEGEGFTRQRVQAVNVLPVIAARHEPAASRVVLEAQHPELDHATAQPWAELAGERLAVEPAAARQWRVALPALDPGVSQPLGLGVVATLSGERRELALPQLLLFPEARTGLSLADDVAPRPGVERFHEDLSADRVGGELTDSAADRFIDFINDLPAHATALWREARPRLERHAASFAGDPRQWVLAAAAGLLLILLIMRRRYRRHRTGHREDPYV